jgi:hydroxymethylglutaryl-CoA reductase
MPRQNKARALAATVSAQQQTLSITTFIVMTFIVMTFSKMTLDMMTLNVMTLSINGLFSTISINDTPNGTLYCY